MLQVTFSLLAVVRVLFLSRVALGLEILALRRQLELFKLQQPRPSLNPIDRIFWTTPDPALQRHPASVRTPGSPAVTGGLSRSDSLSLRDLGP